MITKTALALALVLGAVSFASAAESDPNLFNRYPGHNMTNVGGPALQTRNVGLTTGYATKSPAQSWIDRASFSTGQ